MIRLRCALVLLFVLAFASRLTMLLCHPYSNDELSAINRLSFDSFGQMLEDGVMNKDFHPAGVQVFLKGWSALFGYETWVFRLPSFVLGMLTLLLAYRLAKRLLSEKAGFVAVLLLIAAPYFAYHSILARPYAFGIFFCVLAARGLLELFSQDHERKGKSKWIIVAALGMAGAMYSHYFALLTAGVMGLTALLFAVGNRRLHIALAGLGAVLLYLPHLPITIHHLSIDGGLGWLGTPPKHFVLLFWKTLWGGKWMFAALAAVFSFAVLFWRKKTEQANRTSIAWLLVTWFVLSYAVGHVYSYWGSPILKFPVLLFATPFLILAIGSLWTRVKMKDLFYFPLAFLALSYLYAWSPTDLLTTAPYGTFDEVTEKLVEWRAEIGAENIVQLANVSHPNYLNFYLPEGEDSLRFVLSEMKFDSANEVEAILEDSDKQYCMIGFAGRMMPVQVFESIRQEFPVLRGNYSALNSGAFLFAKGSKEEAKNSNTLSFPRLITSFPRTSETVEWGGWSHDQYMQKEDGHLYVLSDKADPYGPNFTSSLVDDSPFGRNYLRITVKGWCEKDAQITATLKATRMGEPVTDNDGKPIWLGRDIERYLSSRPDSTAVVAFEIPSFVKEGDQLKFSFWNRNGEPVYLKEIRAEWEVDYWTGGMGW